MTAKKCVLVSLNKKENHEIPGTMKSYRCGRAQENDIICLSRQASRHHCVFIWVNGDLNVIDSNSSNGIFINNERQPTNTMVKLKHGDIVGIGTIFPEGDACIFTVLIEKRTQQKTSPPETQEIIIIDSQLSEPKAEKTVPTNTNVQEADSTENKLPTSGTTRQVEIKTENDKENQNGPNQENCSSDDDILICFDKNHPVEKPIPHEKLDVPPKLLPILENSQPEPSPSMFEDEDDDEDEEFEIAKEEPICSSLDIPESQDLKDDIMEFSQVDFVDIASDDDNENCLSNFQLRKDALADGIKSEPEPCDEEEKQVLQRTASPDDFDAIIDIASDSDEETTSQWIMKLAKNQDYIKREKPDEVEDKEDYQESADLEDEDENIPAEALHEEEMEAEHAIDEFFAQKEPETEETDTATKKQRVLEEEANEMEKSVEKARKKDKHRKRKRSFTNEMIKESKSRKRPHSESSERQREPDSKKKDEKKSCKENERKSHKDSEREKIAASTKKKDAHKHKEIKKHTKEDNRSAERTTGPAKKKDAEKDKERKLYKRPEIIEAPYLPKGENRACSVVLNRVDNYISKLKTSTAISAPQEPPSKKARKSSDVREEKSKMRMKERAFQKQEKIRRQNNQWATNPFPPRKTMLIPLPSKEDKKKIVEDRKLKLSALAKKPEKIAEAPPKIITKPVVKVSKNSRNDLLTRDIVETVAGRTKEKPEAPKISSTKLAVKISMTSRNDLLTRNIVDTAAAQSNEKNREVPKRVEKASAIKSIEPLIQSVVKTTLQNAKKSTSKVPKKPDGFVNYQIPKKREGRENLFQEFDVASPCSAYKSISNRPVLESPTAHLSVVRRSSILKINNNQDARNIGFSTKKRVSFNDTTTVKNFEIPRENTLRKYVKNQPGPVKSSLSLEDFLIRIYHWNPIWLKECKTITNSDPPIVNPNEMVPLLSGYKTFNDYYTIMKPLLLLEMWALLRNEFKPHNMPGVLASLVENSCLQISTNSIMFTNIKLETVVNKKTLNSKTFPSRGDLVSFVYYSSGKMYKIFGYVVNLQKTILKPSTLFNKNFDQRVKDPFALITFMIQTKPLTGTPEPNRLSELETVVYLKSHLKMIQALQSLPKSPLMDLILSPTIENYRLPQVNPRKIHPSVFKANLNPVQKEAVLKVTEMIEAGIPKVCLIQGPPGTGKSRVIVNMVKEILANKKQPLKILLCAPSNAAVDELALRLMDIRSKMNTKFKMVRTGRNEAMHSAVTNISLANFVEREVKRKLLQQQNAVFPNESIEEEKRHLDAQINAFEIKLQTNSFALVDPRVEEKIAILKAKKEMLCRPFSMMADSNMTEQYKMALNHEAEKAILDNAEIIICTLNSCYTKSMGHVFKNSGIPVCIVDEATQSCEAETLIPLMLKVKFLVLVGDSNQLPATVISQNAKKLGLDQSLFSRIQASFENEEENPVILLNTQYRMNFPILDWPNRYFYNRKLQSEVRDDLSFPLHAYRVMNLDSSQDDGKKFSNTAEAQFVANIIQCIMTYTNQSKCQRKMEIGVITPYKDQKSLILAKIKEKTSILTSEIRDKFTTKVNTIDGFQGQEQDVIIMSCVRSNGIGFLNDKQRLCVALTRAKHSLFLCGNFKTFKKNPMWEALLKDARGRGILVNIKAKTRMDDLVPNVVRAYEK